jgi:hypothetical protein
MKKLLIEKTRLIILLIIFLIVIISSIFHEIWRDEGEMLQIAYELSYLEILKYSVYEGFFPFHILSLKTLIYIFNNKIFALKFFNLFYYFISILIIYRVKKIPNIIFFLLSISYPFACEYALINRHYIVLLPSIFYLIFTEKKKINFVLISLFNLLFVGIFGIIILFSYITSRYQYFYKNFYFNKIKFFVLFFAIIVALYYVYPIGVNDRTWSQLRFPDTEWVKVVIKYFIYSLTYIHDLRHTDDIWNNIFDHYRIKQSIITFSTFYIFIFFLKLFLIKDYKNIIFSFLCIFILVIFLLITERASFRHLFSIFFIVTSLFIRSLYYDNLKLISARWEYIVNRICSIVLFSNLIISGVGSSFFLYKEINYNFSNSKKIAEYFLEKKIQCDNIASYPAWTASSWVPYMNNKCLPYQIEYDRYSGFNLLNNFYTGNEQNKYNLITQIINKKKFIVVGCENKCEEEKKFFLSLNLKNNYAIKEFAEDTLMSSYNRENFILFFVK